MKFYRNLTLITLMATITSCSQMLSQRDYLAEMGNDGNRAFYNPRNDFPVVAGDDGKEWETDSERQERTPLTPEELQAQREKHALREELAMLEGRQSDSSSEMYVKYKHLLPTTSERIYYLKLSHYDRQDYLAARGAQTSSANEFSSSRSPASALNSARRTNLIGMSKSDVMNSFGRPTRVEIAGNPSFENERWLYSVNGATKYIYFESGRVGGWE